MYRGWTYAHWHSHRAHVGGLVDANVTFYLVETFISMNVQWPVAIGADEVNTWVIFYILSILYIIEVLIVYILSNSGIKWWGSRWYSLLQWFSISRVRCLEFDLFGRYIRHNFSYIGSFSTNKTSIDSSDVYQLNYGLRISCWCINDAISSEKYPFFQIFEIPKSQKCNGRVWLLQLCGIRQWL